MNSQPASQPYSPDPITTNKKKPRTIGPTGYCPPFFVEVSGTDPLFRMFFWNLAILRSEKRLDVVCKHVKAPIRPWVEGGHPWGTRSGYAPEPRAVQPC